MLNNLEAISKREIINTTKKKNFLKYYNIQQNILQKKVYARTKKKPLSLCVFQVFST